MPPTTAAADMVRALLVEIEEDMRWTRVEVSFWTDDRNFGLGQAGDCGREFRNKGAAQRSQAPRANPWCIVVEFSNHSETATRHEHSEGAQDSRWHRRGLCLPPAFRYNSRLRSPQPRARTPEVDGLAREPGLPRPEQALYELLPIEEPH